MPSFQDAQSSITRELFDDYRKNYYGDLQNLSATANDPTYVSNQVDNAVKRINTSFDTNLGGVQRSLGRYNLKPTPDQQGNITRNNTLDRTAALVDAKNRTRLRAADTQSGLRDNVFNLSKAQLDRSLGNYSELGGLESQRQNANAGIKAQNRAQNTQAATSALSTALMFALL